MTLAAAVAPVIDYGWAQAYADMAQVGPILAVTIALLVAMVLDLVLPRPLRGPVSAAVSAAGLLAAVAIAAYRFTGGYGGAAYSGFVSGDAFALFFEILFGLLGLMTVAVASPYLRRRGLREAEFHVLVLAATTGMMALASATSLVTVFLGLELLSVALYIASGYLRGQRASQESATKYLLIGGFASAFVLYGMALVYGATGSTVLTTIAGRATADLATNPLLILGILFLGAGFAFKVSAAPFHQWTPDVYQGAPLPVTAFMSVGTKAAAFAMILRVFDAGLPHLQDEWRLFLAVVAVASMLVGNLAAIVQGSVKRMLAYSGVAQAGYILVGVIAGGRPGIAAVLFYLFGYLFMNFGAFAVVAAASPRDRDADGYADLEGLGYRNPVLGVLMSVFMFSLAGFPPSVGFIGKFFLFSAGVGAGYTWLVVVAVLSSVVSVYYYFRVLARVWSPVPEAHRLPYPAIGVAMASIVVAGIFAVGLGIVPALLYQMGISGAAPLLAAH